MIFALLRQAFVFRPKVRHFFQRFPWNGLTADVRNGRLDLVVYAYFLRLQCHPGTVWTLISFL
jgi:hypothetical protein